MPKRHSYSKCGIDGNERSLSKSKFYRAKQYKISRNRFEKRFFKRPKYKSQQNSNLDLASFQTKMLSGRADLFDDELNDSSQTVVWHALKPLSSQRQLHLNSL